MLLLDSLMVEEEAVAVVVEVSSDYLSSDEVEVVEALVVLEEALEVQASLQ